MANQVYVNNNNINKEYIVWNKKLGAGGFGEVRKAYYIKGHEYRAIKIL